MSKEDLIKRYFTFFEKDLLPRIEASGLALQKKDGWQGLETHSKGVVFRGIDYALSINKNPIPVIFAAALHDIAKTTTSEKNHEIKAIPIAKKIMLQYRDLISKEEENAILYAIANHTKGKTPPDYISACLWDADRTRVAWILGYQESYFYTNRAKEVATKDAEEYLDYQNKCLQETKKDPEMILEYRQKFRHFKYQQLIHVLKNSLSKREI